MIIKWQNLCFPEVVMLTDRKVTVIAKSTPKI